MSTPEHPMQESEVTQADLQVCRACGSVILRGGISSAVPSHELDMAPLDEELKLASSSKRDTYSPSHRDGTVGAGAHKRLFVRGNPDVLIYVLGSKSAPPSDFDLRFAEFVDSTTPEQRTRLAEERRSRLAAKSN